jgi:IS30 family transposase
MATALYVLPRETLRSESVTTLWQAYQARRQRVRGQDRRGQIPNMTPITERPTDVATQTIPGYWEGNLLRGARNGSAVGTKVERTTRLVLLVRMDSTVAVSAYRCFTKNLPQVPTPQWKTLTDDRGKEMADHAQSSHRLAIQVFFADPHGPWQRGTTRIPMASRAGTCRRTRICRVIPSGS